MMLPILLSVIDDPVIKDRFAGFVYKHKYDLLKVAFAVLKNRHDSEDAVQNALYRIAVNYKTFEKLTDEMQFAYACRAVHNHALNILASRERQREHEISLEDVDFADDGADTLEQLCENESLQSLKECISALPDAYRDTLYLYIVEEMKPSKISALLGEKKSTVKQRIARGRAMLADMIKKGGAL